MSEKKVKAARKAARVASAIVVDDLAEPAFERDMRVPQWPNRKERRRLAREAQ
jgi:hypothetical protein